MEDITLKIKGSHLIFGGPDDLDLTVAARMLKDKDRYIINYQDQDLFDTEITVRDNEVTMRRIGEGNAQIIFEKATPYTISYNTQYGLFGINLYTTMVDTDVCEDSGKIEIEYLTDLMGEQIVNKLHVSYVAQNNN